MVAHLRTAVRDAFAFYNPNEQQYKGQWIFYPLAGERNDKYFVVPNDEKGLRLWVALGFDPKMYAQDQSVRFSESYEDDVIFEDL